jgi:hypothetical protein
VHVDGDAAGDSERLREHDVRRLAPDAGQRDELFDAARNFAD